MSYTPERRVNYSIRFVVEYKSVRQNKFVRSAFDNEKSAREYYQEKKDENKRPKLFREINTVELEELV